MPEAGSDASEAGSEPVFHSVVVPVYNSAIILPRLYVRLIAVMEALEKRFEVIFVDDDSIDTSWAALETVALADPRVSAIRLARNVGQGAATMVGLRHARGAVIVTLDDDFQHVPEDIPHLLQRLNGPEKYNVVFGLPQAFHRSSWRRTASWAMNMVFSPILRKPVALRFSGFRAMRRSVAAQLLTLRSPDPFVSALLFQITPHIGVARVEHFGSALASSRYSFGRLARLSLGYFGALSDGDRERFVVRAVITGAVFLAFALIGLYTAPATAIAWIAIGGAIVLAIGAIGLASAGAVAGLRIRAFRRAPAAEVAIRRMISAERKTVSDH